MKKCGCNSFPHPAQSAVVVDSRVSGGARRRRYECKECSRRWTTWESLTPPIDKVDMKQFPGPTPTSKDMQFLRRQSRRKISREVY